ncbi:MAG TPA: nitrite/sulfite reductase [Vicinamibacterales bacterium]|nr:nitrite/sulfite reductase [Vicinamibacterales bacterium]
MAVVDDPRTYGRARLSFAEAADIDEFASVLAQFEQGEIGPDQWRAFRLLRGTYGQRQAEDAQMLRVKIPQGVLTGPQLEALADVAELYSRGFAHITTRQNIQFHFMKLHDVEPAMRRLAEAGLTTREACGNSVRNITACPFAGLSHDEVFDVTPYAEALTRYLLRAPLSSKLPRKFKIGFEGCAEDHTKVAINDLGFRATSSEDGARGFRVTVGGGTAIMCRDGAVLHEFIATEEIYDVADAVMRVFAGFGDYEHKQRNRLKFLIKSLGWERFVAEYRRALDAVRSAPRRERPANPDHAGIEAPPAWPAAPVPDLFAIAAQAASAELRGAGTRPSLLPMTNDSEQRWLQSNVLRQRQHGYAIAMATVPLGDLTSPQFRIVADLAASFSDGTVRVTVDQNLVFRWVKTERLHEFYQALAAASLAHSGRGTLADVVSCPGAETCRIAVTQSRGLGHLLGEHLRAHHDVTAAAGPGDIKISGCPNGCGQHHIAAIGFQGSIRKLGDRAVPQYFVMVGGGVDASGAVFGRIAAKIPARRAPQAVDRLVALYQADHRDGERLFDFLRRADLARVKGALADLESLTEAEARPEDFIDLAEDKAFAPEVMDGECSA